MDSSLPSPLQADPRDNKKYHFIDTPQRRLVVALLRALFAPIMKMEVTGQENFPHEGPVIFASNHVTNYDVFPIQFSISRPLFFMGKAELFKNPLMDVFLRNLSAFPVNRGDKDLWSMKHALKVLRHGQALGMFPEGTRSQGRGLSVAKTGTARLAIEAQCPIVPVTVVGSNRFFEQFPRRTLVRITLLPALMPKPNESPLALTDRLMFTIAQALPEEMRGVYARVPEGFGG
ncbi:MAG: lysophospholipid acyltransferase family protein [Chloroflexota bacterium]